MIIDETFMLLYKLYKVGNACGLLSLLSLFFVMFSFASCLVEEKPFGWAFGISTFITTSLLFVFAITPSKQEVTAYAAYAIGEKCVTSETAKRMLDAAINYLEGDSNQ